MDSAICRLDTFLRCQVPCGTRFRLSTDGVLSSHGVSRDLMPWFDSRIIGFILEFVL